ncbi:MAG: ComF family protein [Clostridia bacterium]|nr:ComF family protein [Clostridia bacterium]
MAFPFGEILWPPRCFFCDEVMKIGEGPVCSSCREKGLTGGKPRTRKGEFFTAAAAPFPYRDEASEAVVRLKRPDGAYLLKPAAAFVAETVRAEGWEPDVLTWIPLDLKRRLSRGFNRSEELSKAVAGLLGVPAAGLLEKTRSTGKQGLLSEEERKANVFGAFRMKKGADAAGKTVLIVDDVITTGATASEAARILLSGGAEKVFAAALAMRD